MFDCDHFNFSPGNILGKGNLPYSEYRNPITWRNKLKSSNEEKIFLSFFKYVFVKYHIPEFLNQAVISYYKVNTVKYKHIPVNDLVHINFLDWYICLGQGGSLYKEYSKTFLSRKETAYFIKYGKKELSLYQNLWFARAITLGCDFGFAMNIARILDRNTNDDYHLSVMRFFINNPVHLHEMQELFDCFNGLHNNNPNFNLKKRTLEAVRILSKEWHRLEIKKKKYSALRWDGHPIDDWIYEVHDSEENIWTITQILKTNDLIAEGHAMRHCVGSYTNACKSGYSSIWSLKRKNRNDLKERKMLTIEIKDDGSSFYVAQIRGYANRLANRQERDVVNMWLYENDIRSAV